MRASIRQQFRHFPTQGHFIRERVVVAHLLLEFLSFVFGQPVVQVDFDGFVYVLVECHLVVYAVKKWLIIGVRRGVSPQILELRIAPDHLSQPHFTLVFFALGVFFGVAHGDCNGLAAASVEEQLQYFATVLTQGIEFPVEEAPFSSTDKILVKVFFEGKGFCDIQGSSLTALFLQFFQPDPFANTEEENVESGG